MLLLGALFVALIFLSSYISSSNIAGATSTTTKAPATYLAIGASKATITGYSAGAYIALHNQSNSTIELLNATLSVMETNGSISNYIRIGDNYQVTLSGIDAYALQQNIRAVPALALSNITASAHLLLPSNAILYVNSYPVNIMFNRRNYSASITRLKSVGSIINVSVFALITANGSVYNNQVRLNYT